MKIIQLIKSASSPFFSFEFFPPADVSQWPNFFKMTDELAELKPLFVSITYGAGGARQDNTLQIAKELVRRKLAVLTHLTCVGANPDAIRSFLSELSAAGACDILALRGDPPKNCDNPVKVEFFKNASDLVQFIKAERPEMGVGVAAYPFPHPESRTFEEDRIFTAKKLASGADFAITQLFFDVREYIDLVENLNKRNIRAPIIPGVMTIQSFDSLRRVLSLCGARIPASLYLELEEANSKGGAEAVREAGLAFAVEQIKKLLDCGAPGIHLYTLNKSGLCRRIIEETGMQKPRSC